MSDGAGAARSVVPGVNKAAEDEARADVARAEPPRCGRWRLKPFELARPVRLGPGGPLTLGQFLAHPDPAVLDDLDRLDPEGLQRLVLARLADAPPDLALSLFGEPGYTMRDVVRHVEEGTPLGVRVIEAERKLVGLLLTEALTAPDTAAVESTEPPGYVTRPDGQPAD